MPNRKLIAIWIGIAATNTATRSREVSADVPFSSSSVAPTQASTSAAASCSAAAKARASKWIDCMDETTDLGSAARAQVAIDHDEQDRVASRRAENYSALQHEPRRAPEERRAGGGEHHAVRGERELALRPAGKHQPLVVMAAMRAPEALAAHDAAQQCGRRIDDEGREDQQRKPRRPGARREPRAAQRAGEE